MNLAEEEMMGKMDFYDKTGCPVAYTQDGIHIYTFAGQPVAYLDGESVYSFSGRHLGWLDEGWINDNDGGCVYFSQDAQGGPAKPMKQAKPAMSERSVKPAKSAKSARPARVARSLSWSPLSGGQFFEER